MIVVVGSKLTFVHQPESPPHRRPPALSDLGRVPERPINKPPKRLTLSLEGGKGEVEMKKLYIAGLILAAACASFAAVAAPAFAEDEWLAKGVAILEKLAAETPIELTLISLEKAGGAVLEEILCSVILDGQIGPKSEGLIEDMLSLSGETIGELGMTNEKALDCTVVNSVGSSPIACKLNTLVELWTNNLNLELSLTWKTQIELMGAEPLFLNHIFGAGVEKEVGFTFKCELNSGIPIEELCEGLISAALENTLEGVRMAFNWENPIGTETSTCSLLGAATGALKGSGLVKLTNGEFLAVS